MDLSILESHELKTDSAQLTCAFMCELCSTVKVVCVSVCGCFHSAEAFSF